MIRRPLAALAALVLLAGVAGAGPSASRSAGPQVWTWPGCAVQQSRPPGNDKLQDCIDGALPADSIELTTNQPIAEFPAITKSLTLFGSPGFHPSLVGAGVYTAAATTLQVTIRHLTLSSRLYAQFSTGSGHFLSIDDVTVAQGGGSSDMALDLEALVPATIVATRSRFDRVGGYGNPAILLVAHQPSGLVTFSAIGDRISEHGAPGASSGVYLDMGASGTTRVNLVNDAIWDVAGGGFGGIFVHAHDRTTAQVNIVGTTVHHSRSFGLYVRSELSGGRLALNVFDSIFSQAKYSGIRIDSTSLALAKLRAGHNDFYRNGQPNLLEGRLAGTGNLAVNPRYVNSGGGDLRLRAGSPLIDQGIVCPPGGIANPDAAGHSRLAGASVDIGAYEFGAGPPRPLPACR